MKTTRTRLSTRNPLNLLLALLLVVAVGLFAYSRYVTLHQPVDPWTLIPDDAVVVLETSDSPTALRRLQRSDLWTTLLAAPGVQDVRETMTLVDSLHNSQRQTLGRFLTGKRLLLSLHPGTDSSGSQWLFYVPIQSVRQHRYLRTLAEDLVRAPQFRVTRQEVGQIIVTQVNRASAVEAENGPVIAFTTYRNVLVASPSRALLDRAVARLARGDLRTPAPAFAATDYLKVPGTYANVWLNFRQLPDALRPLVGPTTRPALDELTSLCREGLLGAEPRNETLTLRGFANPEVADGSLARALGRQAPSALNLWPVLSARTAVLLHLGVPDPRPLRAAAHRALAQDSTEQALAPLLDSLVATLRDEVALCLPTATGRPNEPVDRLAYAYVPDPQRLVSALGKLPGGRGRTELFGGYVIRPVRVPELPRRLFGTLFGGFGDGHDGAVVIIGHYAVFGPTVTSLRALLIDLAGRQTLDRAGTTAALLVKGQRAATVSLFVQTANAWTLLQRALRPERRVDALRHESVLRRFPQLLLQFARPDAASDQFYTTLVVQHAVSGTTASPGAEANDQLAPTATITLPATITAAPTLIRGGLGGPDVVVQDANDVLHAVDGAGREVWTDTLGGPVVEPLFRTPTGVGRPRVLLATRSRLYSLEAPSGRDSENFPFYLSDSLRIQHLTAFAPEGSDYTLLVDDPLGNLYAFNANGRAVPGWEPRQLGDRLADAPRPVRLDGRDYVVVALQNGDVFVLDAAGGVLPGFPVSAGSALDAGCLGVVRGSNTRNTQLSVLAPTGQLNTWNLRGELVRQRSFGPAVRADYSRLVMLHNGTAGTEPDGSFVVSRELAGRVTLFDPKTGTTLLSRAFVTATPKDVQAWRLVGGGGTVFALSERGPRRTYLFDGHGKALGSRALDSNGPVAVSYAPATAEIIIWSAYQNTLRRSILPRVAQ